MQEKTIIIPLNLFRIIASLTFFVFLILIVTNIYSHLTILDLNQALIVLEKKNTVVDEEIIKNLTKLIENSEKVESNTRHVSGFVLSLEIVAVGIMLFTIYNRIS